MYSLAEFLNIQARVQAPRRAPDAASAAALARALAQTRAYQAQDGLTPMALPLTGYVLSHGQTVAQRGVTLALLRHGKARIAALGVRIGNLGAHLN